MDEYKQQLEDITAIRSMMENASRFISLSGLSGVSAGIVALIGAGITYAYLNSIGIYQEIGKNELIGVNQQQLLTLIGIAVGIFVLAASLASYFTIRRARMLGKKAWSPSSRRLAVHILIPLAAGAIFCILMAYHGYGRLISSATLIFYGIALVNASKFTLREIRYLGYTEIALGLIAVLLLNYDILIWAIGFGFFHILYGIVMYLKYERPK